MLKDWFERKLHEELGINKFMGIRIFCIIKETEKAVYAMLDCGCNVTGSYIIRRCAWVPKSCIESDISEIRVIDNYENAKRAFDADSCI